LPSIDTDFEKILGFKLMKKSPPHCVKGILAESAMVDAEVGSMVTKLLRQ
jgi:hypothetical protein